MNGSLELDTDALGIEDARLRRSGFLAGAAFFLLVTSLFLAWWVVSNVAAGASTPLATVWPLGSTQGIAHEWAKTVTASLLLLACALLFLRVASRAWVHEPRIWRRDLGASAILVLLALASGMLWPIEIPFWGGRTYLLDNQTGERLTIAANPGLGWWTAAVALVLFGWAWWLARPRPETNS